MTPESDLFYSFSRFLCDVALMAGVTFMSVTFLTRPHPRTLGRVGYWLISCGIFVTVVAAFLDMSEEIVPFGRWLGLAAPGENELLIMLFGFAPGTILVGIGLFSWIKALVMLDTEVELRKQTQAALKEKIRAAEEAYHAKAVFLASMSHELRTPLNAVIGFAQILKNDEFPTTPEQRKDYLETIERSGTHLLHIINDILDLSRLDSGEMQLRSEACDIEKVVEGALEYCAPFISSRALTIERDIKVGAIMSDERAIRQIMLNLISNAVKFNRPDGRVRIKVARAANTLKVRVEDTGSGMSEAEINRALEPFSQVSGHLARRSEGIGLGLSLADRLVRALGGTLSIDSTPGTGTIVVICLPLHDQAPAENDGDPVPVEVI
ncbi:sensor histidine kinase [Gimibacter soli]|uniref:histidine kinase n=1 Tax=Gimibacter soli TaxID=3024400 RepID=A0AAF0BN22_9PROT|nr:HAMP domain-containing sensor histidine kinase [Gimibacter soli]WCL55410.1 HAMP domain-containing sensor histidine kinase [Gimibacter soli]